MNKKIIVFNFIYYAVIVSLIKQGRDDPSSSLGYGIFLVIFLAVAAVLLAFLLAKKVIEPTSLFDKIGIYTATPLIGMVGLAIFLLLKENISSEEYFNKDNYRYKVLTIDNNKIFGGKRIEYYRSMDPLADKIDMANDALWVKDSTWIYLSETGDTIKKIKFKNDIEVK